MNIIKFLDSFTTDALAPDKKEQKGVSRRQAFGKMGSPGKKLAASAIPLGAAVFSSGKVMAQTASNPVEALQLALTLEYLEDKFYQLSLESGVIPGGSREEKAFMQIGKHEKAHVDFLIAGLGDNSIDKPEFDFTAGGAFDPFNNAGTGQQTAFAQMLALAQAFEDTGVRAYKGQAANLITLPRPAFRSLANTFGRGPARF